MICEHTRSEMIGQGPLPRRSGARVVCELEPIFDTKPTAFCYEEFLFFLESSMLPYIKSVIDGAAEQRHVVTFVIKLK